MKTGKQLLKEIITNMAECSLDDNNPTIIGITPDTLIIWHDVDPEVYPACDWFEVIRRWRGEDFDWWVFTDEFKELAEQTMKEMDIVVDWHWTSRDYLEMAVEREVE